MTTPASIATTNSTGHWVLFASVLAASMAFIDATALNVALPAMQSDFNASATTLLWILNSYTLPLTALLLVGGALGDRCGRRKIYMIGIAAFAVASAVCGFAPDTRMLIGARVLQGVGAALMIPGSLAIITATFSADRRGKAIGTWGAISAVATAFGPVIGGILARYGWWRGVFFINVPLAIVALVVLAMKVPESRDENLPDRIDLWGAVLGTLALVGINYGCIEASSRGLREPVILVSLVGGVVALVGFIVVESRSPVALLPMRVFRSRPFTAACLLILLLYISVYAMLFFYPLNLIQVQGYNAALAGVSQLPLMVFLIALSRWAGGLVDRHGPRWPLTAGSLITMAGFLALAMPGLTHGPCNYWTTYMPAMIVLGCGLGMTTAPLSTAIMSSVESTRVGLASGINSTVGRLSSVLAIAIIGPIIVGAFAHSLEKRTDDLQLSAAERSHLAANAIHLAGAKASGSLNQAQSTAVDQAVKLSFVDAFRRLCYIAAGLSAISAALAVWLLESKPLAARGKDSPS